MINKKKDNNKIAKIIVTLGSLLVIGVAVWSLTYKTPEKTDLDLKEESIRVAETKAETKAPEVKKEEVKKEEAKPEVKAEEPKAPEAKEEDKKEEVKTPEVKAEAKTPEVKTEAKVEKSEVRVEAPKPTQPTKVETKPVVKAEAPKPVVKPTQPAAPKPTVKVEAPKSAPKPATPAPKPTAPAPKPVAPKPAPAQPKPVAPAPKPVAPKPAPKPAVTVVSTTTETKEEIRDVVKFTSTTKLNNTEYVDWSAVDQAGKDGFTKYTLSRTVTKMSDGTVKYGDWKTTSTAVTPMVPEILVKGTMERSKEGWDYAAIDGVIAEINKYRASKGLPQATYTKTNYAAKMMAERGFNHFGGSNEIIAAGTSPVGAVRGWISSGGHRTTLELPGNVHYYVGVYRDSTGYPFYSVALEG